jgi:hypothetical protein
VLIRATSAALVAGLLVAACGEEQSSASCGDAVRYDGVTLVGAEVDLVEPLPPATGTREAPGADAAAIPGPWCWTS